MLATDVRCRHAALLLGQDRGGFYSYDWLERLVGESTAMQQVRALIERVREAGRLTELQLGPLTREDTHALVRDAAYAMLTEKDRVLGHRLAAEWLEARGEMALGKKPLDWASAQMSLGAALQWTGVQDTGTDRLREGEAAQRPMSIGIDVHQVFDPYGGSHRSSHADTATSTAAAAGTVSAIAQAVVLTMGRPCASASASAMP